MAKMKSIYISDDDMCTTQKLNLARVQKWLMQGGYEIVDDPSIAEKIICMTCNGWSLLESRSYERIESFKESFEEKMIVMGCVVDAHLEKVESIFNGPVVATKSKEALSFSDIEKYFPDISFPLNSVPAQSQFRKREDYRDYNPKRSFINIAEGCAFNCSFCTHKPGLGKRRSRGKEDIISQIKSDLELRGIEVLHLMGMETALWGTDIGETYPELLESVIDISDEYEIHVAQFQPHGLKMYGERLVELFSKKRVSDIQIPIQSTSDRIMKMMNRKNHAEIISPLLKKIKKNNNRVVLRTDVIVGWPTETESERLASLDFAVEHFDEVAVYAIELHEDLPAWKYHGDAFSPDELNAIVEESRNYVESRNVTAHSGQQDDASMARAESKRKKLRTARHA